jgi:exodeoxyribonuclease III
VATYRIVSWNVNGIRAVLKKNFFEWLNKEKPDILCVQEIKCQIGQLPPELQYPPNYQAFFNPAERPGYSGVATFSKDKPVAVKSGIDVRRFDCEGRVIQTEYPEFTLLNIYFPNGKMNDDRLRYKMDFYDEVLKYFTALEKKGKRLVVCGDYNTAHKAIDLKNPVQNEHTSGFLPIERAWMDKLVEAGFIDTFRVFDQRPDQYSWWDMRTGARLRNVGWRIDYHFISQALRPHLKEAWISPEVLGSDHCPVGIELQF